MKIGIILEPDIALDELTELGLLAERQGIHTLWVQNYATGADPFMSLVPLARATRQIRLGVVIVSPWEMHREDRHLTAHTE
jgi:alkanesulfonate monooxygenase SsuD/methylene tetrahydromethanopterin reductase-like flavin-dependent oxidoreductase (luciferase family)